MTNTTDNNLMDWGDVIADDGADPLVATGIAYLSSCANLTPSACLATRGADGLTNASKSFAQKGRRWCNALCGNTNFQPCLPPNAPSCGSTDAGAGTDAGKHFLVTASSNHSGGVNVCMMDGSVRFVSETIDTGDLNNYMSGSSDVRDDKYKGPSKHGVWGAMATPKGKETVSMDF